MCKFENSLRVVPSFFLIFHICLKAINKPSGGKILVTVTSPACQLATHWDPLALTMPTCCLLPAPGRHQSSQHHPGV